MVHPFVGALACLLHHQCYVAAFGYLIFRNKPYLWSMGVVLAAHTSLVLIAVTVVRVFFPLEHW